MSEEIHPWVNRSVKVIGSRDARRYGVVVSVDRNGLAEIRGTIPKGRFYAFTSDLKLID